MRNLYLHIILLLLSCAGCNNNKTHVSITNNADTSYGKKLPSAWIDSVRNLAVKPDHYTNDSILLKQFSNLIKPDSLSAENQNIHHKMIMNMMFVDLDGEPGEEMIGLVGYDITSPDLCVIKKIKENWHLIYKERIDTFYDAPTLSVAGNYSKNKVFYLRRVYDHGSGIYLDGYTFYKLINNKVYNCLDIIGEASIYGWGLYINQKVNTSFEFKGTTDAVGVTYSYNFFPGSINSTDCAWCAHEEIALIEGEDYVSYKWDEKNHSYKLDIPTEKNNTNDLTEDEIACFGAFGNDSLFVNAFKNQINETLKKGNAQQKRILKDYLQRVQKYQNTVNK